MYLADFPAMLGGIHSNLAYIAAPYGHQDPEVIEARMDNMGDFFSLLMSLGIHAVSPLMNHPYLGRRQTPGTYEYWGPYSINLLRRCDALIVVMLDGWKVSTGVQDEIKHAMEFGKPIFVCDVDGRRFQFYSEYLAIEGIKS
jgi:hypothetical protein